MTVSVLTLYEVCYGDDTQIDDIVKHMLGLLRAEENLGQVHGFAFTHVCQARA